MQSFTGMKIKYLPSLSVLLTITIPFAFIHAQLYQTTSKYDSLLNDPNIAEAIVWENASGSTKYSDWSADKKTQLLNLCTDLDSNAPFPINHPPDLTEDRYFIPDDAWMIYLTHVAHSLWLEANHKVSWSITDFSADQLSLLLDSRTLMKYDPPDQYSFDAYNVMGRVTDWDIRFSYDFMEIHDFIKSTQDSTVYAFAYWCRKYLLHIAGSSSNPDGYEALYGYRGYPLVNRILDPLPETYGHLSAGCWGTSGLFAAVMRSVNIPVEHRYVLFSSPGDNTTAHSRIALPTINKGLCHSDDLYNQVCKPTGNVVPTEMLFPTLDWLRDYIDDPIALDSSDTYANRPSDQAMFNMCKHKLDLAVNYLADYLLYERARDDNEATPPILLENALIGPSVGGSIVEFAKPYFSESERQNVINRVDEELRNLGSGSWEAGKQIVTDRWTAPYEKDDYTTTVNPPPTTTPQSFRLLQNFPNPFNQSTCIRYKLNGSASVKLAVHDILGRQICMLDEGIRESGTHTKSWDGRDEGGLLMPSGIYLIRLQSGKLSKVCRLVLIR